MSNLTSTIYNSWDPHEHIFGRSPSKEAIRRIRNDLRQIYSDPPQGIYVVQDEILVTLLHAIIVGPFDTPYEGGFFYFVINCPDNYPHAPPKVKLVTTGKGRVRFNPNLYANGKVCLSILGTWSGPSWSEVHNLSSVLISIQSLMCEHPFLNEPGFEEHSNRLDINNYDDCIRHETLRIAVCDMLERKDSTYTCMPDLLSTTIKNLFPNFIGSYEIFCQDNMSKDGQAMIDPFMTEPRGIYSYSRIFERIQVLKTIHFSGGEEDEEKLEIDVEPEAAEGALEEPKLVGDQGQFI